MRQTHYKINENKLCSEPVGINKTGKQGKSTPDDVAFEAWRSACNHPR